MAYLLTYHRNETTCHKKPKTAQTSWELKLLKREKDKERKELLAECKKLAEAKKEEERELQRRKKRQREENLIKSASYQVVCCFDTFLFHCSSCIISNSFLLSLN